MEKGSFKGTIADPPTRPDSGEAQMVKLEAWQTVFHHYTPAGNASGFSQIIWRGAPPPAKTADDVHPFGCVDRLGEHRIEIYYVP